MKRLTHGWIAAFSVLTTGVLTGCGADQRTKLERPDISAADHATLIRIAATTRIADTQVVSFGATLDLRSSQAAQAPDPALLRAIAAALRTATAHGYKSASDLASAPTNGVRTTVVAQTALSVLDPRYRLAWVRIEWVVGGPVFRATPDLCLMPTQRLVPDDSVPGLAICQPYARGFTRAKSPTR